MDVHEQCELTTYIHHCDQQFQTGTAFAGMVCSELCPVLHALAGTPETTLRTDSTKLDQDSDAVKSLYSIMSTLDELSSSYGV
jgi:hypothetical protein